jgi:hypothetical protein
MDASTSGGRCNFLHKARLPLNRLKERFDIIAKSIRYGLMILDAIGEHARSFLAIIDSGADNIILPAYIAELFGIDKRACRRYSVMGISLENTPGFVAELDFRLQNHSEVFTAPVVFIEKNVPPLLGQEGFFDNYRVKFEKDHDTFEIASPRRR